MGILRIDHPDILDFITIKSREGELANFNISVAVTDKFMRAVESDGYYELINPRNRKVVRRLKARNVFDMMAAMAWKTGDPGIIFIDEINRRHPCSHVGEIESTNPCGEVPLLPYESCNLGSINLSKFVKGGKIDWKGLRRVVRAAVHFLDNVIDVNDYPVSQIEKMTKANRKIGLGVMGWAEMLIQLGIPYNSERALRLAEEIMKFISEEGRKMSVELGKRRGSFPNFKGSLWDKKGYRYMRNGTLTTIAPTGTISIIAGTSSGIEPLFAVSFVRRVLEGTELLEVNPFFKKVLQERGLYSEELMRRIAVEGSIQKMTELPRDIRRVFVTSLDISPEWHVRMQAAWQRYTDNAVSKTINLPFLATPDDVKNAYLLAYKLKCKGITIYRYGSKEEQVLTVGEVPLGLGLEETGCLECEIA
jgi:ribonucleoside-diphosphate reductase alpha chain